MMNKNGAGGGNRTHTTLRSSDFESDASTNSATPACVLTGTGARWRIFNASASKMKKVGAQSCYSKTTQRAFV